MTPGGKPYIIEVNPNPEISDHAGFSGCLEAAQVSHRELILPPCPASLEPQERAKTVFRPGAFRAIVATGGEFVICRFIV